MRAWLHGFAWFLKAVFVARELSEEEIATTVLAHLAERGRTRTYELWKLFDDVPVDPRTLKVDKKARYVSLAKIYAVLGNLEEAGEVYGMREMFEGRVQVFWNINSFGGKRGRSREAERGEAPGAAVPATAG